MLEGGAGVLVCVLEGGAGVLVCVLEGGAGVLVCVLEGGAGRVESRELLPLACRRSAVTASVCDVCSLIEGQGRGH